MIFKCSICENVFGSARGLTLHSKACTKSNKKKDFITGVQKKSTKHTSLQESSARTLLPNLDEEANILESIIGENNLDREENFTDHHNFLINQESEYNARNNRDGHNLWSPSDLAKLSLLNILHKHNCHNNAFEDILKWASHCNNLSGSDIFKYSKNMSRRDTFLDNLCDRRNMQKMKPVKKKISLENNHFIEVTTFDFKQQLLSMFRDKELMDPQNLVLEEPGTVQNSHDNLGNSDHISDIRDSEWYKCAYEYYDEKLGSNENRVICGIILTVDKTHTDWKGKLCLEPVHFSLSIFNKETRKKDYTAWRCLGFVNDLDAYSSSRFFQDDVEYFSEINIFDAKTYNEHDIGTDDKNDYEEEKNTTVTMNNKSSTKRRKSQPRKDSKKKRSNTTSSTTVKHTTTSSSRSSYSEKKSIIYHKILSTILESLRLTQEENGLLWDIKFASGKIHRLHFVFPVCLCVVDMKGARQLCGMYDTSTNIKRPCVSCFASFQELDKHDKVCKPVEHSSMKEIINNGDNDELKLVSQHRNKENAFFKLCIGGWKYGIWGLCPTEVLHQFYEGAVQYALEEFFDEFLTNKYRRGLTKCVQKIIDACKNQSDRNTYPYGTFTLGITKFRSMKGTEKFGCLFLLSLFLHTKISQTQFFEGEKEISRDMLVQLGHWRVLFETCLYYNDWLMSDSFERHTLLGKQQKILRLHSMFKKLLQRKEKGIKFIPKFHEFLHIIRNILWHGPPRIYDTKPTESNLRVSKAIALNTRQQIDSFCYETGKRLFEYNLISSSFKFVKSIARDELYDPVKRKVPYYSSLSDPTKIFMDGAYFARFCLSSKDIQLSYKATMNQPLLNNTDFPSNLISFLRESIFYLLDTSDQHGHCGSSHIVLPCFTNMIRNGIFFRALSRDKSHYPGWAMIQWSHPVDGSVSYCPGKIIMFLDFSKMKFHPNHRGVYTRELYVVIQSLTSCPTESHFSSSKRHICTSGTIEHNSHGYYCVSVDTIFDTAFVIPDFGNINEKKVLYVFPRRDYENANEEDDGCLTGGWASKF